MDRELVLKQSREALKFGKAFIAALDVINEYDENTLKDVEILIADGDKEFVALNEEFNKLFEELNW
jgi:hypothetical protein